MLNIIIVFGSLVCAVFYVFVVPLKLKKNKISNSKNIFEYFVENDSGYAWSRTKERKKSYKIKMNKTLNSKKIKRRCSATEFSSATSEKAFSNKKKN